MNGFSKMAMAVFAIAFALVVTAGPVNDSGSDSLASVSSNLLHAE